MNGTLAKLILEAHRDAGGERRGRGPWRLVPDHVVLDEAEGTFAWSVFASDAGIASRVRLALIAADARGVLAADRGDAAGSLERAAIARGLHFARPGTGRASHLYAEFVAAPGRFAIGCAEGLERAGALGMLAWRVSRIEAAAALAGEPIVRPAPVVRGVQLAGDLVPGVSGHDLVAEIGRRRRDRDTGSVLELRGSGVERLAMRDRFVLAASAQELGVRAVVLPSDEITRAWMRANGREADWKRFAVDVLEDTGMLELDLERVEPWLRLGAGRDVRRAVRHAAGTPVRRVVIGPGASYGDWAAFARLLTGRAPDARVAVVVVPGSRTVVETARANGVWSVLEQAGVRFDVHGAAGPARRAEGVTLEFAPGAPLDDAAWSASLESCAAAARSGIVTDPREVVSAERAVLEPERYTPGARLIAPPPGANGAAHEASNGARPSAPSPWRGSVLLRVGDDIDAARVLPWGPRAAAMPAAALSALAFAPIDPSFPARAMRAGGGWLAAGHAFLGGPRADLSAWVLARLGVRVVIADSFAPDADRHLVHAGILPLLCGEQEIAIEAGDELELPGGLDVIEPGAALTVRNLTRGAQALFTHPLDEHELDVLRAGGLMRLASQEGQAA